MRFNPLIPEFAVSDIKESLAFYASLGFVVEYHRSRPPFAFLSLQGSQLMIEQINETSASRPAKKPFGQGMHVQIRVESIKPVLDALDGKKLLKAPYEKWYKVGDAKVGNRQFIIQDPDGYVLRIYEDLGSK